VPVLPSQHISTTKLGLERIDDDEEGDSLEPGTLNQHNFIGLPRIWQRDEDYDCDIECNITARQIVDKEIQVNLQDS
jgi:hypothetical protein